jgi:O-methyltransferase involved in polyketide biosynthesis
MSDAGHFITHVSDTARWTALHRATASARADALFSDPLAERLAAAHGRAIVARVPRSIADGCDGVLNLAAGLDTRPYRLDLPSDFPWIKADLPQLFAEKTELLADHTPRCRLTRAAVDLSDPDALLTH